MTWCKQGDIAVIIRDEPGCEANVGTLVRVGRECTDFPEHYGVMWVIEPLTPGPHPVLIGVEGSGRELYLSWDEGPRSHFDGWLRPIRGEDITEEEVAALMEQTPRQSQVNKQEELQMEEAP